MSKRSATLSISILNKYRMCHILLTVDDLLNFLLRELLAVQTVRCTDGNSLQLQKYEILLIYISSWVIL